MRTARQLVDLLRAKQDNDKSLGQHFLINDDLITKLIEFGNVSEEDHVLEIGPGPGVLTEALLATGCTLTAIEIDIGAVEHLRTIFPNELKNQQLTIHQGDALQTNWPPDITKVIANIPFQISSPLIELLTRYLRSKWQHLAKVILRQADKALVALAQVVSLIFLKICLVWEEIRENQVLQLDLI